VSQININITQIISIYILVIVSKTTVISRSQYSTVTPLFIQ